MNNNSLHTYLAIALRTIHCVVFENAQGIKNLLTPEESKRSLEEAVSAWKFRKELEPKIGKGLYVLAVYDKIKRITMPLDDKHLLYVTMDGKADHESIIEAIMRLADHSGKLHASFIRNKALIVPKIFN